MQRVQNRRVQAVVDEHADSNAILRQRCGMHVQRGIEVHERKALPGRIALVGLVEETTIVGAGTENGDLHGGAWREFPADHTAAPALVGWPRR